MISILIKLKEAIESSRKSEVIDINERFENDQGRLFLKAKMSNETLLKWQKVYDERCDWLTFSFTDSFFDSIKPEDGTPDDEHIVNISIPTYKKTIYIITHEGWRVFLNEDNLMQRMDKAYLLFSDTMFATISMEIEPWLMEPINHQEKDFRKHTRVHGQVKRFTNDIVLPSGVEPWILSDIENENENENENELSFKIWRELSIANLSLTIVNEIYTDNEKKLLVCLSGKPPKTLRFFEGEVDSAVFDILQESVSWVYLQGDEVEIKHTFLSNELAREWPPEISYSKGLFYRLPLALQSAKLLYKAHIRSSSKETIKTLSELRKTLTEDVQKIVNQTKEVSTTLWKDVALALGTVILKYSTDTIKFRSLHDIYNYILFILAAYLISSLSITIITNRKFNKISENNRAVWRGKLYAFLDDSDYRSLAEDPIKKALKAYGFVCKVSFLIVTLISLMLVTMGLSENHFFWNYFHNTVIFFPSSFRSTNSFW